MPILKPMKSLSLARQKRIDVLDKAYWIFRFENFPLYLKPIRLMMDGVCAISKKTIARGDYAYRCYENPVRLSPTGPAKCLITEAEKISIHKLLPDGYFIYRMPTTDEIASELDVRLMEKNRQKFLSDQTTKLLKEHKK